MRHRGGPRPLPLARGLPDRARTDPSDEAELLEDEIDEAVSRLYELDERDTALIGKMPRP